MTARKPNPPAGLQALIRTPNRMSEEQRKAAVIASMQAQDVELPKRLVRIEQEAAQAKRERAEAERRAKEEADRSEGLEADLYDLRQRMTRMREGGQAEEACCLSLERLKPPAWNCWKVDPDHVARLVGDILERGLLEPLMVDCTNRVIGGEHRRQAIEVISREHPAEFARLFPAGVPVYRHDDLDSMQEPFRIGLVQVAANFQRKKAPSPKQIAPHLEELLKHMPADRYHFGPGNPRGKVPVVRVLAEAFGVSPRTVFRAFADKDSTAAKAMKKKTPAASPARVLTPVRRGAAGLRKRLVGLPEDQRPPEYDRWLKVLSAVEDWCQGAG